MKIIIPFLTIFALILTTSEYGNNVGKIMKCLCKVHDPIAIQNVSCWAKSYNRTYTVANVRANMVQELNHILVNFQLFRRSGISYRPFLVNVTEDYCAFFAKNRASKYFRIFGSIYLPYTNLNHTCPYSGEAIIKDMPLPVNRLESIMPVGEYRVDALCYESNQKLLTMEFYVEIFENVRKRRPL